MFTLKTLEQSLTILNLGNLLWNLTDDLDNKIEIRKSRYFWTIRVHYIVNTTAYQIVIVQFTKHQTTVHLSEQLSPYLSSPLFSFG